MNTENTTKKILHPRPDKWREEFINLNGEWEFFFDEPTYDRRITVPFSWASPLSGIGKLLAPRAYPIPRPPAPIRTTLIFLAITYLLVFSF